MALPFVPLAIVAAGFWLASRKRKQQSTVAPKPPSEQKSPAATDSSGGLVEQINNLLPPGIEGVVAGAGLLAAERKLTSDLAYTINGEEWSRYVGAGAGFTGVAAVGGAEISKEVAKVFGGREEDTSTVVLQAAVASTIVLGGGGGAGVLFLLSVPGIQLIAAIWLVSVVIEDANRLAYGQKGALEDYRKEWLKVYDGIVNSALANGYSETQAQRVAFPSADGYMLMKNQLARERWMHMPRGVGLNESQHETWGRDRGYFVANPPRYASDSGYAQYIPRSETTLVTVPLMRWVEEPRNVTLGFGEYFRRAVAPDSSAIPLAKSTEELKAEGWSATEYVQKQIGTEQRYVDNNRWEYEAQGMEAGNVAEYVTYMKSSRSAFQSELSHLNYGKSEGRFYGEGDSEGKLTYNGRTYDYRQF